jgi:uncharacterized phage protein (TIGR02218 family)
VSYLSQEQAVETGRPLELYFFRNNVIITQVFAYTSAPYAVTYNAVEYIPRALTRTDPEVEQAQAGADRDLQITMPENDPLVNPRWITTVPPGKDELTIYRQHASDGGSPETITYWKGFIDSVSFQGGGRAVVRALSEGGFLRRTLPTRTYRGLCGHVLYDGQCKVARSSFAFAVEVTAISSDGLTVTVQGTGISGQAGDFFEGGELHKTNGDRRMVLAFTDLGGDSGTVKVLFPMSDLAIGNALEITAGCDHVITTCRTKFSNEVNYGGFPWIPTRNPFNTGIG